MSVAKGLLTVGAADQAVLYDLGNSQPTTELVLPNFLSPTTMPVSFFSSAIPSPKHAVIVPSSFAPHTGFNTKLGKALKYLEEFPNLNTKIEKKM